MYESMFSPIVALTSLSAFILKRILSVTVTLMQGPANRCSLR